MSYAGHVIDMINRVAQNRQILLKQRQKAAYLRDKLNQAEIVGKSKIRHKEISPEKLRLIKAKIREDIKRERQRAILYTFTVMAILLILIYFVVVSFLLRHQV